MRALPPPISNHEAEQRHLARWRTLLSNTRAQAGDDRRVRHFGAEQ